MMTPEERDEMIRLCSAIQTENDHDKFSELVQQLNELLDRKNGRLTSSVQRDNQN
jgi:hypothetical protein